MHASSPAAAACAAALICLIMTTPRAHGGDLLIKEDFSSLTAPPAGWITAGSWKMAEGRMEGSGEVSAVLGDPNWKDVAIEAELALRPGKGPAWCALLARVGDRCPEARLALRVEPKRATRVELAVRDADGGWHMLQTATAPAETALDKGVTLRLEVAGAWFRGYLAGVKVIQSPRVQEACPVGRVGIAAGGGVVSVKSVTVSKPDTGDLPSSRSAPLVIAHRGFSFVAPENTLVSYRKAMETCADMAECDVYLTSDGVPILHHDRTLQRTAGVNKPPSALSLAEIRKLDAGTWKAAEYKGEPVPTLEEALKLVHGRLRLVIEIKQENIEKEVLDVIRKSGTAPEDVMIFSFYRSAVEKIAQLEPLLPTTWLIGDLPHTPEGRQQALRDALKARASAIGLPQDRVDPEFVRQAHQCGLSVFVWTVNHPQDMEYLVRTGVDAMITDRPDVACDLLRKAGLR